MDKLQPLNLPLNGSTLIEASAGTGKTYTITTLFIRLLLEKKCAIDQILVVTFTIAATEELRIKIRERVAAALECLEYPPGKDETLNELLSHYDRTEAIAMLSDVAARLDELAVFTIDAMCLRVLKDFAFDSKLPMRMEFIANDEPIRMLVVEDYWRRVFGGKDYSFADQLSQYKSPAGLLAALQPVLQARGANVYPQVTKEEMGSLRRDLKKHYFRMVSQWEASSEAVSKILRNDEGVLKKNMYQRPTVEKLLVELPGFFDHEVTPAVVPKKFELLTASKIASATRKGQPVPQHLFFDLCEDFPAMHARYEVLRRAVVLQDARDYVIENIDRFKRDRGLLHFEDLRLRLSEVLTGANGSVLADKIRQCWPYAMIDESQDTDPQQNSIFQSVYRGQPDCGLFYIGDPKQAIYSFRGADVFTYMSAAKTFDRQYTLAVNWRSSARLVTATNALFGYKPNPFIFDENITYYPVDSAGMADKTPLLIDNEALVPLQFRVLGIDRPDEKPASDEALEIAAESCAGEIVALLNSSACGSALIGDRPLNTSDIAVLVRSHRESGYVQRALRGRGVKSASNTGSTVFSSQEALDLLIVLSAISRPSVDTIRRALAVETIGYTAMDIDRLNADEAEWDKLINQFVHYRGVWLSKGLMAAVQTLFIELSVVVRVLGFPDGERRVTNLVQLTELLQVRSREMSSTEELLVWLENQIALPSVEDEQLLRLESDQDLVQIVTIHKSKGLEYPVVFIPFGWTIAESGRNNSRDVICFHERSDFASAIDFGSEDNALHKSLQLEEDLSETLRLMYVAITRAKYLCVVGCGVVKSASARSALGYLLHRNVQQGSLSEMKVPDISVIVDDLTKLAASAPGCVAYSPMQLQTGLFAGGTSGVSLSKNSFSGYIDRNWSITSYTGLQSGVESGLPDYDFSEQTDADSLVSEADDPAVVSEPLGAIARLPAGARTGQLLHEILETIDFTAPELISNRVAEVLERYGSLGATEDWQPVVESLVANTLETTLQGEVDLRLCELEQKDRVNELEFFFSINKLDSNRLADILGGEDQYLASTKGLKFSTITGLMRGFIDLVARKDGKYFIVDYKSNLLGAFRDGYRRFELGKVISSHRYDLQYLIYTVALHRFLRSRLGNQYQYDSHFGGVYYLFVRGMKPGSDSGVWFDKPSSRLIEQLDQCFDAERLVS